MKANMSEEQKKLVKEVINGNKDKEVELKKNKDIFANYNRIKRKIYNNYIR